MQEPGTFRMTPQRAAVLAAVRAAADHPSARDIYARVRRELPSIGVATVYRTLDLLVAHRQILELQLGDGAVARYDGNTGPHDHVTCTVCGAVADVHVRLPEAALEDAASASGFRVEGYDLQFVGRCPDCR